MKEFIDKVAVITGATSAIGRAIADQCGREGMKVILADIEGIALTNAEEKLKATGKTVLAIPTDVSKAEDVETLAQQTYEAFGEAHLLVNNADVSCGTTIWESTLAEWNWVLDVNLWGVIHGVRAFVPRMLEQETEGHIVNTATIAGLVPEPEGGIYNVTKHAVVSLSETLSHELTQIGAKLKVSVLCSPNVDSRLLAGVQHRPIEQPRAFGTKQMNSEAEQMEHALQQRVQHGLSPQQVAKEVFTAIRDEKFYILTHPSWKPVIQSRMQDILHMRPPTIGPQSTPTDMVKTLFTKAKTLTQKLIPEPTVPKPVITVVSPKFGDVWYEGQTYTIKWKMSGSISKYQNVRIDLLHHSIESQITPSTINNGSFSWKIPYFTTGEQRTSWRSSLIIRITADIAKKVYGDSSPFDVVIPYIFIREPKWKSDTYLNQMIKDFWCKGMSHELLWWSSGLPKNILTVEGKYKGVLKTILTDTISIKDLKPQSQGLIFWIPCTFDNGLIYITISSEDGKIKDKSYKIIWHCCENYPKDCKPSYH